MLLFRLPIGRFLTRVINPLTERECYIMWEPLCGVISGISIVAAGVPAFLSLFSLFFSHLTSFSYSLLFILPLWLSLETCFIFDELSRGMKIVVIPEKLGDRFWRKRWETDYA